MAANHHFSASAEIRRDDLFSVDRRHNALTVNLHNSHVRTVTDDSPWPAVAGQAAAQLLQNVPNVGLPARSALIRSSLRGDGRPRWR